MSEAKQGWVEDIKPTQVKERSSIGIVELVLGEGQKICAVGAVYGVEHSITGPGFEVTLFLDQYSQRIKILRYQAEDFEAMILAIRWLAEANGFDKIFCMASRQDWQRFLRYGYVLEAVLKYYLKGEDAFIVSKFRSQERLTSRSLMDEILLIERIMESRHDHGLTPLPEGHTIGPASRDDIPELLALYKSIFETYPSPLVYLSYLETVFQKETLFAVCKHEGKIVSAASAELHKDHRAAELTDCATHPSARGRGLMSHLLRFLEEELIRRDYVSAFTMARSCSFGMNSVFHHLGYEFAGRLVNSCDIYGAYEDMNIWVRDLRRQAALPPKA